MDLLLVQEPPINNRNLPELITNRIHNNYLTDLSLDIEKKISKENFYDIFLKVYNLPLAKLGPWNWRSQKGYTFCFQGMPPSCIITIMTTNLFTVSYFIQKPLASARER